MEYLKMNKLNGRFLLPKTLYMATAVLLIGGQSPQGGNNNHCRELECTETLGRYNGYFVPEPTQYLKLNRTGVSTNNFRCQCQCEYRWYKTERCNKYTETAFRAGQLLNFGYYGMNFSVSDQGKYMCFSRCQRHTRNQNCLLTYTPVVVTIYGVATYFVSVYLNTSERNNDYPNAHQIENCVKQICLGLQAETCLRDFQNQINKTRYAEGYIYLEGSKSISKQQLDSIQRTCNLTDHFKIMSCSTTQMFQSVSFCESNSTFHKYVGGLTFPKTNIGMNASSKELCPGSEKPLATMFCKGDFIRPSCWDALIVNTCNEYDDIDPTPVSEVPRTPSINDKPITTEKIATENISLSIKSLPDEILTLSTTKGIDQVTNTRSHTGPETDHISEATTMSNDDINDGMPVTKGNIDEVSTSKDIDDFTKTSLHTSSETDHISEATTISIENINDGMPVTKENVNEVSTTKDIDNFNKTSLHTGPETDHNSEATTMSSENINDGMPVTKENVNEVSTIKDIDDFTKTRSHTVPETDHISEATTMSSDDINDGMLVTKEIVNDVSTTKDIDNFTKTRSHTGPETDHITEATTISIENINDGMPVTKENVNEVSTTKDIDYFTKTSLHTGPETDHISEATTMSSENINDGMLVTKEIVNEVSTTKDIDNFTKTRSHTGPETDDISQATTMSIENINDGMPVTKENVNEVSLMLSESTKNPENVDEAFVMLVSERLKNICEIGSSSPEVTRNVLEIVDNLLDVREHVYEESISRGAASRILQALETQLTNLHKGETNFTDVKSSLGVAARQFERSAFLENITFGGFFSIENVDATYHVNESEVGVMAGDDKVLSKFLATITLPANLLDEIWTGHSDRIPVTFIIHRSSFLFMSSNSRPQPHSERVESLVIAATVEGHNVANLSSPVISRFQLPHVDGTMAKHSRKCVFWDSTLANGLGNWSSEGCELVSSSEDNTGLIIECHCSHLTNFAVLLDVQGDIGHIVLDILSIIGCVVSIFSLVITLIVLLAVKKLREQIPQKIIINLCLALLGLYIFFLVGIDQSSLGTGCVIFGALIHYFCLASLAWMCVVATNMYLLFVRVFNADVTSFMWKAYLAAWGLPMIVIVVSVILKHENYSSSYCFPQTGTAIFYLGVLLLIGLMLCYNIVIFILIIRQVTCGRIGRPAGQDKRTETIERAQSIIIISVLLGLTWIFGFLSLGGFRFIFNLLFLIFNSLQGFFVFVFFILRPKNVRTILFKRCYRCQDDNIGSYTVNKSKTDGTNYQKDTLDMDAVVVTRSDSHSL